jgi:hypothetical protein
MSNAAADGGAVVVVVVVVLVVVVLVVVVLVVVVLVVVVLVVVGGSRPQFGRAGGAGEMVPSPLAASPTMPAGNRHPEASPSTAASPKP